MQSFAILMDSKTNFKLALLLKGALGLSSKIKLAAAAGWQKLMAEQWSIVVKDSRQFSDWFPC